MSDTPVPAASRPEQRLSALSRWENEGGALEQGTPGSPSGTDVLPLANAELLQLRVRVIALENLVMALFVNGTDAQRCLAREMADYILPRPGHTPHAVTIHAAARMVQLIERAGTFSSAPDDAKRLGDAS